MTEKKTVPTYIPFEALTQSDRMKRIDQAQLFFAELTRLIVALSGCAVPLESDVVRAAQDKAFDALQKYQSAFGSLPALVEDDGLVLFDDKVCQAKEPVSIADKLRNSGVKQITFMKGLEADELMHLAIALLDSPPGDDACADRIWESGANHVWLDFESDFFLPDVSAQETTTEVNFVVERLFASMRENTGELRRLLQGNPAISDWKGEVSPSVTAIAGSPVSSELQAWVQDALVETEKRNLDEAVQSVFDIIHKGRTGRPDSLEAFFCDLVKGLLRQGDLRRVRDVIQRISSLEYENDLAMTGYRLKCALKGLISHPENLNTVSAQLVQETLDDPETVSCILDTLDESAVIPLLNLLPAITAPENRRMVCDALVKIGRDDAASFIDAYKAGDEQMARDMLTIIDACDFSEKFQCIEDALNRPDLQTRLKAVAILSSEHNVRTEAAFKILGNCLNAPVSEVRLAALQGLVSSKNLKVGNVILLVMQSEAFNKWDVSERSAYFDALGELKLPASLPYLSQVLAQKKRGFFGGSRLREDKLLAVRALSKIVLLPSYKILQGVSEDKDNESKVREEAAAACAVLKKSIFGS